MAKRARVIEVLVSSPSDVTNERDIIAAAIQRWNSRRSEQEQVVLLQRDWIMDSTPAYESGTDPQAILNRDLVDRCDIVVALFKNRIGTGTARSESGTVEEIKRAADAGKVVAVYFSDEPVSPSTLDVDQLTRLRAFKAAFGKIGLYGSYRDRMHLQELVRDHLEELVRRATGKAPPREGGLGANVEPGPDESPRTPSNGPQPSKRFLKVEATLGFATGYQDNPYASLLRSLGARLPDPSPDEHPILLIVKAINDGTRPVVINSWGIDVQDGIIIPPMHARCTSPDLPARLQDGETLVGWVKYEDVKDLGVSMPRDTRRCWVQDASGFKWYASIDDERTEARTE